MNLALSSATDHPDNWENKWPRLTYVLPVASLLIALLMIWFLDPILMGVAAVIAFFVLCVIGAIGVIILLYAMATRRSLRPPLIILGTLAGLTLLLGATIRLNGVVQKWAADDAKAYPERVAPMLEAYHAAHGVYPQSLHQLSGAPWKPRLLHYGSNGKTYFFSFPRPGGIIDIWQYSSESHQWHLST